MTSWSRSTLSRSTNDARLFWATRVTAIAASAVVFLVIAFLVRESWRALTVIGPRRFVSDAGWHPLSDQFNMTPMLAATVLSTTGAVLLAAPLGVAVAAFTLFYAGRFLATPFQRLVELLAGIPSVVFGLWGLVVLAPLIANFGGSGQNLLTATFVLALMILPTIALTAQAALGSVSRTWIEGGAALGLGRWAITWKIVIPAARRGIATGVLLAVARAMGETMAVLMVAGNVVQLPRSLVTPVRTLTGNMALELGYADSGHRSALFVSGLVLLVVVSLVIGSVAVIGGRRER